MGGGGVLFTQGSVAAQKCSIGLGCGDLGGQVKAGGSGRGRVDASVIEQIYFSPISVSQRARFRDPPTPCSTAPTRPARTRATKPLYCFWPTTRARGRNHWHVRTQRKYFYLHIEAVIDSRSWREPLNQPWDPPDHRVFTPSTDPREEPKRVFIYRSDGITGFKGGRNPAARWRQQISTPAGSNVVNTLL